ncbi:MAG: CRTAC1 family protein [Saprospiraceae bacterium]
MIIKILYVLMSVILVLIVVVGIFFYIDANGQKYDIVVESESIPQFMPIAFPFTHVHYGAKSLPLMASAAIDTDNDGIDEVFMGGGSGQSDVLLKYNDAGFIDISDASNLEPKGTFTTIAVATADMDGNGFQDLVVSREDGFHFYYNTNGKFRHQKIVTSINEKSTPAGITLGDIDKDGDLDIFLSTYIKKELMEGQTKFEDYGYGSTSELLLNEGNQKFTSITTKAGLDYVHNTFMAILTDVDADGYLDLIVAHDTGEVRTYRNNGDLTFTMKENPLTKRFAYPMGIAVGDYNNDTNIDFAFSNTGSTLPSFIAKGDIKDATLFNGKYLLFKNNGNFTFSDVAEETKIADYEFSWGLVFADMNNDGLQDLMVAQNYVDFFPNKLFRLPGRLLIQKADHTFAATEKESGLVNPHYGITPLVSDFNGDGHLDFIWANINSPSLAYINKGSNKNYLKVYLPKNAKNIGAIATVYLTSGATLTDHLIVGEGLAGDQSSMLHFGLGNNTEPVKLEIKYPDGEVWQQDSVVINSTIHIAGISSEDSMQVDPDIENRIK